MSKTILVGYRGYHQYGGVGGLTATLVFDVDGLCGDEAISYVLDKTMEYIVFQAPEDGYDYSKDEYRLGDLAAMCDENQAFLDYLAACGIAYLGHEDEVSLSVCDEDMLFFNQEELEEFRLSAEG